MLLAWIEIIAGLGLLVYGADRFVTGAAQISKILGISPLIIGITIVGMATSIPEVLVGSVAAFEGKTHIAVGNAIGSNIANLSLVLGGAASFQPFFIASKTLRREYILMMSAILLAFIVMADLYLGRVDAIVLMVGLALFLWWTVFLARHTKPSDPLAKEINKHIPADDNVGKSVILLIAGLFVLFLGAEVLVNGAIEIAKAYGLSDLIIGLTIIAVGTSLPELAASIMSIIKKEADLAIGNIIGSNIFNMLAVLGIPVIIHPVRFEYDVLTRDFSVMFGLSLLLGFIIFAYKKFDRICGISLLLIFLGYQTWLITTVVR